MKAVSLRFVCMGAALAAAMALAAPAFAQGGDGAGRLMEADANKDGRITREEAQANRAAAFDRLDTDKDGFITATDRRSERPPEEGRAAGRRQAAFMRLDADGDGKVSRQEFVNRETRGFDRIDANQDGAIDSAEIAAFRASRPTRQ